MTESVKIVALRAENVKRLQAVEIRPSGDVVEICGDNDQGKSSVLDSIAMALGGKQWQGEEPLRQGTKKGAISITLNNGLTVTRTLTPSGGALTVMSADGAKYPSPQAMLDKLVGDLSFDPMEFCRMKPADQLATLKRLVGLDFSEQDRQRQKLYDERTNLNRDAKRAKDVAESLPFSAGVPDKETSVSELAQKLEEASIANREADEAATFYDIAMSNARQAEQEVARLEEALTNAKAAVVARFDELDEAEKRSRAAEENRVDTAPLREQLQTAEEVNRKIRANVKRSEAVKRANLLETESEALTRQIEAIDDDKRTAIANAAFPVPGLGFNESVVTFDGVPFSQIGTAQKMKVSGAIGMAMNPKLRVLLVRDASLISENKLGPFLELAKENDFQVWMEKVDTSGEIGIVIEDGMIKAKKGAA